MVTTRSRSLIASTSTLPAPAAARKTKRLSNKPANFHETLQRCNFRAILASHARLHAVEARASQEVGPMQIWDEKLTLVKAERKKLHTVFDEFMIRVRALQDQMNLMQSKNNITRGFMKKMHTELTWCQDQQRGMDVTLQVLDKDLTALETEANRRSTLAAQLVAEATKHALPKFDNILDLVILSKQ